MANLFIISNAPMVCSVEYAGSGAIKGRHTELTQVSSTGIEGVRN